MYVIGYVYCQPCVLSLKDLLISPRYTHKHNYNFYWHLEKKYTQVEPAPRTVRRLLVQWSTDRSTGTFRTPFIHKTQIVILKNTQSKSNILRLFHDSAILKQFCWTVF